MTTKHVGLYGEKKCVVLFREVPNEPENCLIVQTESLEDRQHDDLMDAVMSSEGQSANNLADALKRKQFSSGEEILASLHYGKRIQKVPVNTIDLVPIPGQRVALTEVNAELRKIAGGYTPPKTDSSHLQAEGAVRNPIPASMDIKPGEEGQVAQSLQEQAKLMREDAQRMIEEADAKEKQAADLTPAESTEQ